MMPMSFNMQPQQILQMALQANPGLQNNPQAQQCIQILMSGDAQRGEELARNYCQTYGISPQQGVQQSQNFIRQMFGR